MYIYTKDFEENDEIKEIFITSPLFDIDDVRKAKAFIRFHADEVIYSEKTRDIHTILKFGRVRSIELIGGALYALNVRLAGKEKDTMYHIVVKYSNKKCIAHIINLGEIEKSEI